MPLFTWTLVDLTCGVLAASLPVLSALIPTTPKRSNSGHQYGHGYPSGSLFRKYFGSHGSTTRSGSHTTTDRNMGPPLRTKDSQEGILREDKVELQYTPPLAVETVEHPLPPAAVHGTDSTTAFRGDEGTWPARTFPSMRQSQRQWAKM